ncbi:MAG: hypothetical protein AAGN35_13260 [Bacteroidota bacterium]
MNYFRIFGILLALSPLQLLSQVSLLGQVFLCPDSAHCETGVRGMMPSRWIEVYYEKSTPFAAERGNVGISQFRRSGFRARLPLLAKPGLKMIAGFTYRQEYLGVSDISIESEFPWQDIDRRRFNQRGFELMWLTPFRGQAYMVGRASAAIHNPESNITLQSFRRDGQFSLSQLMVLRPDANRELGLGFYIKRAQGRTSTYPVALYNHTLSRRWGIEALLPSYARLRHNLGPTSAVVLQAKASGGAFNMEFGTPLGQENLSLRRSELIVGLTFQQEIFDPLWIGFEFGVRQPFQLGVFDPNAPRTPLSSTPLSAATYFSTSLFLVPPRKLLRKLMGQR